MTKDDDDLTLSAAAETASISGTVSASGSAAPVAGAKVEVDYPDDVDGRRFDDSWPRRTRTRTSKAAKAAGARNDIHVTGADGTYTVMVKGQEVGDGSLGSRRLEGRLVLHS